MNGTHSGWSLAGGTTLECSFVDAPYPRICGADCPGAFAEGRPLLVPVGAVRFDTAKALSRQELPGSWLGVGLAYFGVYFWREAGTD